LPITGKENMSVKDSYDEAANKAKEVASYLAEQFNRALAQEKAELISDRRRAAERSSPPPELS
jgi:hypothetical protein